MTPDLHPEELLDKAAVGALNEAEREALEVHLRQCPVCRFAQETTAAFARQPMPQLDVEHLVTNALTARASRSLRPMRARRVSTLLAAAVALLALGSFAAVGQWTGVLPRLLAAISTPAAKSPKPSPVTPRVSPRVAAPTVEDSTPPPPPTPAAPPVLEVPPASPAPIVESAPTPPTRRAKGPKVRHASRVTPSTVSGFQGLGLGAVDASQEASRRVWTPPPDARARSTPAALPRESASEAFSAANQARLEGDRPLAMARYRELLVSWPDTPEAQQTHATLGRMLLDRGNPSAALEQLDAYLAGGDETLREEVLSARALALMRLGRVDDEARAWQTLLDQYPGSIHAPRARARLEALSAAR